MSAIRLAGIDRAAPKVGVGLDPVQAAESILRRYGARAVTLLTSPRSGEHARSSARLSANDCYVALEEACRKTARVAVRRYRELEQQGGLAFEEALDRLFPDPVAYLARAIRSVISDQARVARRTVDAISVETPIGSAETDGTLHLGDMVAETRHPRLPETALIEKWERNEFRSALKRALTAIPPSYLNALARDVARERDRRAGATLAPETDRDRQTLCRARSALTRILRSECGDDNPFVHLLLQRRNGRVRQKPQPSARWTGERQDVLFRRLMETSWASRAAERTDEGVDEAVINDVSAAAPVAPPSPELRQTMRVLDLYTVDRPMPQSEPARTYYEKARALRQAGKIEEALAAYKSCYEAEPTFIEALNEVGVMHSQLGNLRDALRIYLGIIERNLPGDHTYIAATNAADIYLTWYDAGRNRERNIELAIKYAQLAMGKPTPMRACNLILAYVKDRYYDDARNVLTYVLTSNLPRCPAEKFLQTLFQIRDKDLVEWWSWLDDTMAAEESRS